jgi:hypothetical protein
MPDFLAILVPDFPAKEEALASQLEWMAMTFANRAWAGLTLSGYRAWWSFDGCARGAFTSVICEPGLIGAIVPPRDVAFVAVGQPHTVIPFQNDWALQISQLRPVKSWALTACAASRYPPSLLELHPLAASGRPTSARLRASIFSTCVALTGRLCSAGWRTGHRPCA